MATKTRKTNRRRKPAAPKEQVVGGAARMCLEKLNGEDEDEQEIVSEGRECWIGYRRISRRTVNELLMLVLISAEDFGEKVERYSINESGRRFLAGEPPYCDRRGKFHWLFSECG